MSKNAFKVSNPMKITTVILIAYSAIIGFIHGIGEVLQAGSKSNSYLIHALDVAEPDQVWHAGLPAFSIIPDFLISGIITIMICIAIIIFVNLLIESDYFKLFPFLFILLFLFGGGFVPPFIGIISSAYFIIVKKESKLNKKQPSFSGKLIASLWIYLISFLILWLPSSWVIGWVFPAFMLQLSSVTFILFNIILPILLLIATNSKNSITTTKI
ncbi:MAG: hypothetical protein K9L64_05360 [Candidatus Izimaplasma sp.]|nr:hypothetical protein [Candidatus Izimaplasma bacterium]